MFCASGRISRMACFTPFVKKAINMYSLKVCEKKFCSVAEFFSLAGTSWDSIVSIQCPLKTGFDFNVNEKFGFNDISWVFFPPHSHLLWVPVLLAAVPRIKITHLWRIPQFLESNCFQFCLVLSSLICFKKKDCTAYLNYSNCHRATMICILQSQTEVNPDTSS